MTQSRDSASRPSAQRRSPRTGRRRSPVPTLNLTPLIDIVFLLIVFFMLATSFIDRDYIPLRFPVPSAEPATKLDPLRAEIVAPGEIFFHGETLSYQAFADRLRQPPSVPVPSVPVPSVPIPSDHGLSDLGRHPERSIVLVASRSLHLQHVVQVIDVIREAGIDSIAILSKPE